MSTFAILFGILLAGLAITALATFAGLRLVRAAHASPGRALAIATLTSAVSLAFGGVLLALQSQRQPMPEALILAGLGLPIVMLVVNGLVIRWLGGTTLLRSITVLVFLVLGNLAMLPVLRVLIKPYLIEAFVSPTNSMAPTIAGFHSTAVCPHCGGVLLVPRTDPASPHVHPMDQDRTGTCAACGKFAKPTGAASAIVDPDRILVNKLLTPRRWDVVVYKYPRDPKVKYLGRLVGLPGETVFFDEDCVWIDGVKTPLPENVGKWVYQASYEGDRPTDRGSRDRPIVLASDECCLLGDFCWISSDSRDWGPAPIANIEGVVTVRYWPPDRWTIFR